MAAGGTRVGRMVGTAVRAGRLAEDGLAVGDAGDVDEGDDQGEGDEDEEAGHVDDGFLFGGDALAASSDFDEEEEDAAAVEHGEREQVEDAEVDREQGGELEERGDGVAGGLLGAGNFADGLTDADGAGELGAVSGAFEPASNFVLGKDEGVPGEADAVGDGLPGWLGDGLGEGTAVRERRRRGRC